MVRCIAEGVDLCGGVSHEKGLRGVGCVQVMCEIGRFGGWWMDVLESEGV